MPKANVLINNFNTGEVSPLINATRSDISKYASACKTLENALPLVEGGAKKMPGSYYAGLSANGGPLGTASTGKSRLVPFQFSTGQGVILEFYAYGVRIWENGGLVIDSVAGASPYDPAATYSQGNLVILGNYTTIPFGDGSALYIASPYAEAGDISSVPIAIAWNTSDALSVSITGQTPNQGISILLATTTASKNAASAIQAAIRALGYLNSPTNNYIDLTGWTVSGNSIYNASPPISSSTTPFGSGSFSFAGYNGSYVLLLATVNLGLSGSLTFELLIPFSVYIANVLNFIDVPIAIGFNSSDALAVTVSGNGIKILLATTTASKNSASAIQTAVQALGSPWTYCTVVGDAVYDAAPPTTISTIGVYYLITGGGLYAALVGSLTGVFPPTGLASWSLTASGTTVSVVTPYQETDVFDLDVGTQSADVLYITHPNYPTAMIQRLSSLIWTYSLQKAYGTPDVVKTGYSALGQSIQYITQGNPCKIYLATSTTPFNNGDKIYINNVSGMAALNEGQFIVYGAGIDAIGFYFNIKDPDTGTPVNSTNYNAYDGGGFAVKIVDMFAKPGNYPACCTFFQQRFCAAGFLAAPNQINGSVQGDYPDYIADPNLDDHAFQFTLVSQKVDQIRRMIGCPNALLLGTAGGVWSMNGVNGQSLSPTNVDATKQTMIGVGNLDPQLANDSVIWVSRSTRIVYFLVYNFMSNQWDNFDLTRLARHITIGTSAETSGIVQTAFQSDPYPIFWAVRADGQLLGLVFNKQDQVTAWFRVKMDGLVESVACISQDNEEDQVWVVVNRVINGVSQRFIEYFMPQELFHQLSNAFFVHAGLQWKGLGPISITAINKSNPCVVMSPRHGFTNGMTVQITGVKGMIQINQDPASAYTITIIDANHFSLNGVDSTGWSAYTSGGSAAQVTNEVTGLTYLNGKTAVAVGDGALIWKDTVPSSGIVPFGYYANLVTIGLPYTTTIEPVNPILGNQQSSTKGEKQKVNEIDVSVYESIGGKFGPKPDGTLYDLLYGPGTKGQTPQMVTKDDILVDFPGDWDHKTRLCIVHDLPYPFTLRSVSVKVTVNPS